LHLQPNFTYTRKINCRNITLVEIQLRNCKVARDASCTVLLIEFQLKIGTHSRIVC